MQKIIIHAKLPHTWRKGGNAKWKLVNLEGLQVCVKEEVIIKVLLEILHKHGYISNMCYFKSIDMLKK